MAKDNTTIPTVYIPPQPYTVTALLTVEIPSIACSLLILIFVVSHWHSMVTKALQHHFILLLTIISLFYTTLDLPFTIKYYLFGYDYYRSLSFCLYWYWLDYTLLSMSLSMTATVSIQRHILIFHSSKLRIRRLRWLLHFIPLIVCILYPPHYYLNFIYVYPCKTLYDESSLICPNPCYTYSNILVNIDWLVNTISPIIIIILANASLLIRVIYSMKRTRQTQARTWRRQKKLSLQLFAFTFLYVIVWVPTALISVLQTVVFPNLFIDFPNLYYIYDTIYFVCPLQVFIYVFTLPELMNYLKMKLKTRCDKNRIIPVMAIAPVH